MRVNGVLVDLPKSKPLAPADTAKVKEQVLITEVKQRQFDEIGSTDVSYFTDESRYRVSAFLQRGTASFVFRVVPQAPDVSELGLPDVITSWADAKRGLAVVTGPTGSGKSTTVAAIIDTVNRRRSC